MRRGWRALLSATSAAALVLSLLAEATAGYSLSAALAGMEQETEEVVDADPAFDEPDAPEEEEERSRSRPIEASSSRVGREYTPSRKYIPKDVPAHLQTAFELYERPAAAALHAQFKKFCKYKQPLNLRQNLLPATSPNFVMGLASGYTVGQVVAFIVTLRKTGFAGSIVLGMDSTTMNSVRGRPLRNLFAKYSVTWVDLGGMKLKEYAQVCRYVAYHDWVEALVPEGAHVMVSDVRDVFFQADPFTAAGLQDREAALGARNGTQLLVFEETRGPGSNVNLYTQKLNRRWILEAYAGDPLGLRSGHSGLWVLCSGTTLGTRQGMLEYTLRLSAEVGLCRKRHLKTLQLKGKDLCLGGADQAFHNVLFYRAMLPGARAVANGRGQVYTVGIFGKFGITLLQDGQGFVINEDRQRVPVVHQADKHHAVNEFLHNTFLKDDISYKLFLGQMKGGARFSTARG